MAYWRLFHHVTWATTNHEPIIKATWQDEVYNVIAAKFRESGALLHAIGGTGSQIHLAASIPPKLSLSAFIGEVKGASSRFINSKFFRQTKFHWQPKFGVVSFSDDHFKFVVEYVEDNHLITDKIRYLETCYVRQGKWFFPFWRLYYHFIWTTKYGQSIIDPEFEEVLYGAIRKKAYELEGEVHALSGTSDHVHLSAKVPPKIDLATFIGDVKGFSSSFINDNLSLSYDFYWQDEYGVFSFGRKALDNVVEYVNNQKQHHQENQKQNLVPLWERTS